MRDFRVSGFYLLSGLVLIWAIFLPRIFTGQSSLPLPLDQDVGFQWIPFKEYSRWAFSLGYFPLWCPYLFAGMPFLAFSHTQVLYPLGWMLVFADYARAVNFYYPIHLSIGFIGLYLLATNLGISRFSSFIVGLGTMLTGNFFYFIHYLPISGTDFWSVWFFYFMVKTARKQNGWNLLGLGLMLTLGILGGNVEAVAYQLLFAPFLFLILLGQKKEISSPAWLVLACSVLLGISLALIQLLPLAEYSAFFLRKAGFAASSFEIGIRSYEMMATAALPVRTTPLPMCVSPAPYFYFGVIGIFFPFYALGSNRKNSWLFLLAIAVMVFSISGIHALHSLVYHIPLLSQLNVRIRASYLFQIFWALLAGYGIDHALNKNRAGLIWFFAFSLTLTLLSRIFWGSLEHWTALAVFCGSALVCLLILDRRGRPRLARKIAPVFLAIVFFIDVYWLAFTILPKHSPDLYKTPEELLRFGKSAGQNGARSVAVAYLGVGNTRLTHHLGMITRVGTIDGWISVPPLNYARLLNLIEPRSVFFKEGKFVATGYNFVFRDGKFIQAENFPLMDLLSLRYFLVNYKTIKLASPYSLANDSWSRLLSSGEADAEITPNLMRMAGNEARLYQIYIAGEDLFKTGIEKAGIDSPVFLSLFFEDQSGKHLAYSRAMGRQAPAEISYALKALAGRSGQLKLATTQVLDQSQGMVLLDPRIENPSRPLQRLFKGEIEIYQNREAFPEAFIVHDCRTIQAPEKILAELKKLSRWDLEKQIILGEDSGSARAVRATAENLKAQGIDFHQLQEPVQKTIDRPDYIAFKAYCLKPGFLFLNHQYLPGWRVYVDGREWRIEKADFCFRAVFVDQGIHTVEFRYQPLGFEIGLYGSIATAFSFILLAGIMIAGRQNPDNKSRLNKLN